MSIEYIQNMACFLQHFITFFSGRTGPGPLGPVRKILVVRSGRTSICEVRWYTTLRSLIDERGGWCTSFPLLAIIAHVTSPGPQGPIFGNQGFHSSLPPMQLLLSGLASRGSPALLSSEQVSRSHYSSRYNSACPSRFSDLPPSLDWNNNQRL